MSWYEARRNLHLIVFGHYFGPLVELVHVGSRVSTVLDDVVQKESSFIKELELLLNRNCMENGSNTPDFILAKFLRGCLESFNTATSKRDRWYGVDRFS